jgi:hypothetical protein
MTDSCSITRITGYTLNPSTGVNTPTTTTQYTGVCRVRAARAATAQDSAAGETVVPQVPVVVSVPTTVTNVNEGDRVTVTASNDPDLVNKVLLVKAVQSSTHITARRLLCEELPDS